MSTLHLTAIESALDQLLALGTLKAYFMDTGFSPDIENDQYYDDISADLASGTAAMTLANVATRIDVANSRVELDADNFSQAGITATTNKFCLVVDTGNGATSPVLATLDISEGSVSTVAGTITITINGEGLLAINAA